MESTNGLEDMVLFCQGQRNAIAGSKIVLFLAAVLWMAGAGVLMLYAGVSYLRRRFQVKTAMKLDDKL